MQMAAPNLPRSLTIFSLAMINVAAVGSVKNWPVMAEYGLASIFYLLLAALLLFIPSSLVAAELATGWPKSGGVFVWVKEAFGHRTGFLAVWLLWILNVIWFPTALSFIAATIAYVFNPAYASNTTYTIFVLLVAFWGATFANMLGMRASSWISSASVILGSFIPAVLIIVLGTMWYVGKQPIQFTWSWASALPSLGSINQLVFFVGVMLSLTGMEMSAIHARDVKHPQKDYPKAILLSALLILGMSVLAVLAIASVVPQKQISLTAGSMQAFSAFVDAHKLGWMTPYIAALIAFGAFGSMSTWLIGPARGLLAAARNGDLPPYFRAVNDRGMPHRLLIVQAIIVSLLSIVFLFMPTVSSAFWILSAIVTQLYLIMYILLFAAAIKLRYKRPKVERAYRIPGGKIGIWIVGIIGIVGSGFAIIIGFFPPGQIETGSIFFYVSFLAMGIIVCCLAPSFILKFHKPSWNRALEHEKEEN